MLLEVFTSCKKKRKEEESLNCLAHVASMQKGQEWNMCLEIQKAQVCSMY